MTWKITFGLYCLFAILSVPRIEAASTGTADIEWVRFSDKVLRFEYPKGWKASHRVYPHGQERYWVIKPPSQENGFPPGTISIDEDLIGREKRTLEEHFAAAKAGGNVEQENAEEIKPKGGRCLLNEVKGTGYVIGSRPLSIWAQCYGKNGHFFWFTCDIQDHGESRSDAEPRRRIFRHLLETLEFK
jgi:hypothetical protein